MQPIYPVPGPQVDPLRIYDGLELKPRREAGPFIAINMVTTVDGKTTIDRNRVREPIGSPVDRGLMRRLRVPMDAVIRGAGTVRADPYYPRVDERGMEERQAAGQSPHPLAVVVSASCRMSPDSGFFTQAPRRPVVLTVEEAPPERVAALEAVADVVAVGGNRVDVIRAVEVLRQRYGVERLLVEGGPRLNYEFLALDLVDEIFWTVAPKLSGLEADLTMVGGPAAILPTPSLELVSAYAHDGELFLRYRVRQKPGVGPKA